MSTIHIHWFDVYGNKMKFKSQKNSQNDTKYKAYYPKLEGQGPTPSTIVKTSKITDLDSLWMEGFLHHEEIELEKKVSVLL